MAKRTAEAERTAGPARVEEAAEAEQADDAAAPPGAEDTAGSGGADEAARSALAVHALLPAIHARPTGGNVFNRRVLAALAAPAAPATAIAVRRRVLRDGARPRLASGLLLVDSLLIDAVASHLVAAGPAVTAVLLVHHLHLLDPELRASPRAAAERRLLPLFAGAVATSRYSRAVLRAEGFAAARVVTVAPGLDARHRAPLPSRLQAGPPRVLSVASLLPGKGLDELLTVLEDCADLPWRWEVAGDPGLDPAYASAFAARLARSPVGGRVRQHGPLPGARLAALYDRCHLFALASRFESCCMAVREAMAHGLPVAAYAVGGLAESLPPATARLLAPAGDRERLRAEVRRLLAGPAARAAAGAANHRAAAAFPGWAEAGAELARFLRRLARGGAGGGAHVAPGAAGASRVNVPPGAGRVVTPGVAMASSANMASDVTVAAGVIMAPGVMMASGVTMESGATMASEVIMAPGVAMAPGANLASCAGVVSSEGLESDARLAASADVTSGLGTAAAVAVAAPRSLAR